MIYPDLSLSNSPPVVVIDVGANSTKIGVLAGGSPAFFRDVSMGSSNLTQEIQRHFNISWEEAEAWKKDVEDPDKFQDDANYGHLKETHRLAKLAAETLVTEIQRALDFFIATSVKADITRIYLTGGGGIPNHYLVNSLERRIEAPVEVLNPFKNLAYSSSTIFEQYPGSWALAIGLALRGLDEETPGLVRINLLGSQKKSSPQPKNRWRNLKALAKYLFTRKQPQKVKVSRQELLYVCDTMNLFMSANVPLLDGLHTLAEAFKGPLAEALIYVRMRVGEGRPLYEPFTEKGFPNFFCLTVKAGEITGTLDIALEKYATNMRKDKPPRKFW